MRLSTPPGVSGGDPGPAPLLHQTAGVLAAKVVGAVFGVAFSIVLARLLGPELSGVYFLALLVSTVAGVIGRGGMDNAVLRFSAVAAARGNTEELAGVRRKARAVALPLSLAASVLVFVGAETIAQRVFQDPRLTDIIRIVAWAIPFGAAAMLDLEVLKGIGRPRLSTVLETVPGPIVGLVLLLALAIPYGLAGAAVAHVLTAAALGGLAGYQLHRCEPALRRAAGDFDTRLLVRTAIPLFWVAVIALLMGVVDTAMLGILADSRSVGIYGVAARVAVLTTFALHAVNTVVAPRFAALHATGDTEEIQRVARNAAAGATALGLPVVAACLAAPELILSIFGPGFVPGASVLAVLALGHLLNAMTGPVGYLLIMTGHERVMRNNMIVSGGLNIALNAWLIPELGAMGAAIGTAVSLAVLNLASTVLVQRYLGVLVLPFPVTK